MTRSNRALLVATGAAALLLGGHVVAQASDAKGEPVHCAGINECKGKGACAAAGGNACKAQNECKGKGIVELDSAEQCVKKGGKVVPAK